MFNIYTITTSSKQQKGFFMLTVVHLLLCWTACKWLLFFLSWCPTRDTHIEQCKTFSSFCREGVCVSLTGKQLKKKSHPRARAHTHTQREKMQNLQIRAQKSSLEESPSTQSQISTLRQPLSHTHPSLGKGRGSLAQAMTGFWQFPSVCNLLKKSILARKLSCSKDKRSKILKMF